VTPSEWRRITHGRPAAGGASVLLSTKPHNHTTVTATIHTVASRWWCCRNDRRQIFSWWTGLFCTGHARALRAVRKATARGVALAAVGMEGAFLWVYHDLVGAPDGYEHSFAKYKAEIKKWHM